MFVKECKRAENVLAQKFENIEIENIGMKVWKYWNWKFLTFCQKVKQSQASCQKVKKIKDDFYVILIRW